MEKQVVDKMLQIEEALRQDAGYQHLMAEHEVLNPRFLAAVEELGQEQQDAFHTILSPLVVKVTEMWQKSQILKRKFLSHSG